MDRDGITAIFFYFAGYKKSPHFYQPGRPVNLERVDHTANHYFDALAVAQIDLYGAGKRVVSSPRLARLRMNINLATRRSTS